MTQTVLEMESTSSVTDKVQKPGCRDVMVSASLPEMVALEGGAADVLFAREASTQSRSVTT